MRLLELKRHLGRLRRQGKSITREDLARDLSLPVDEVGVMLDILGWHGHLPGGDALGCEGQCAGCPLQAICPAAGGLRINLRYVEVGIEKESFVNSQ